jgi:hypothetical protein
MKDNVNVMGSSSLPANTTKRKTIIRDNVNIMGSASIPASVIKRKMDAAAQEENDQLEQEPT